MTVKGEVITDEDQDLWYLRQLDGGLFTLQTVDYILGWIMTEDDGVSTTYSIVLKRFGLTGCQIRTHAVQMLNRKDQGLRSIVQTLQIYHDNAEEQGDPANEEPIQKQILSSLIEALDS